MAGKGYNYADDFDDNWYADEDQYYEEEDDAEDPELAAAVQAAKKASLAGKPAQAAQSAGKTSQASAAPAGKGASNAPTKPDALQGNGSSSSSRSKAAGPAGGSALASYLCAPAETHHRAVRPPQQSAFGRETFPIALQGAQQQEGGFRFDTPSPDEAVLSARSKPAAQRASVPSSSSGVTPAQDVGRRLEGLQLQGAAQPSIAEEPDARPLSSAAASTSGQPHDRGAIPKRPLREYEAEPELAREVHERLAREAVGQGGKPLLHLVVLGHVDAGKSTLMGRLLHDLGHVSQKAAHRAERDAKAAGKGSFAWAWLLDERPEERARGVTVDVAAAFFATPARLVRLLDAPGHQDFVPNMIAGAAQADAALLVVDGSRGGFEAGFSGSPGGGGQTREHAQLARSLGIDQLAVVVSKLDTCDFSQERFEEVKGMLQPFLKLSGFKESLTTWLPAVGPTGENLVGPPTEPQLASWWRGPSVVQAIDAMKPSTHDVDKPLRLPVTDVFKGARGSAALGGRLVAGALKAGTKVVMQPGNHAGSVRSVEVNGAPVPLAMAGDTVDVALNGIDAAAVSAGSMLCHPQWPVHLVSRFMARVVVLDIAMPILKGRQVSIHVHAAAEAAQVSRLVSVLNPKSGEVMKARPRALIKGQTAVLEATTSRPVCLELYTDFRALGRIAIRDGGRTIAVGVVINLVEST